VPVATLVGESGDVAIAYGEAGRGPPLLFLHGLGGSGADWAPLVERFRGSHRVLTPDARGSGQTRDLLHPQGPFTIAQLAADLAALLGQLDAQPAHVVGWSLGGMIGLQLAADRPALVRSLTVVNSGPDWRPKTPLQRTALRLRGAVTGLLPPGLMARPIAARLFPKPEQAALRRDYVARIGRNDKGAYAALLEAIVGWSVLDRLGAMTMPVLCVASDGDYTSVASKEEWVRALPNGRLAVVPDARHALPLEAPEKLGVVLDGFLRWPPTQGMSINPPERPHDNNL
jgi:pimeloyl-ACP methyl ester carboxylesterase